jgi:hypothetical protein
MIFFVQVTMKDAKKLLNFHFAIECWHFITWLKFPWFKSLLVKRKKVLKMIFIQKIIKYFSHSFFVNDNDKQNLRWNSHLIQSHSYSYFLVRISRRTIAPSSCFQKTIVNCIFCPSTKQKAKPITIVAKIKARHFLFFSFQYVRSK